MIRTSATASTATFLAVLCFGYIPLPAAPFSLEMVARDDSMDNMVRSLEIIAHGRTIIHMMNKDRVYAKETQAMLRARDADFGERSMTSEAGKVFFTEKGNMPETAGDKLSPEIALLAALDKKSHGPLRAPDAQEPSWD